LSGPQIGIDHDGQSFGQLFVVIERTDDGAIAASLGERPSAASEAAAISSLVEATSHSHCFAGCEWPSLSAHKVFRQRQLDSGFVHDDLTLDLRR
jgi:hypothetical protein